MKRVTLSLDEELSLAIAGVATEQLETAGVLIVGVSETPEELRLLGREFWPAPAASYVDRTSRSLNLNPAAYMRALSRADEIGGVPLFLHSHPVDEAFPSLLDHEVDDGLRSVFQIRANSALYGSIVVHWSGSLTFTGRLWAEEVDLGAISLLREIGSTFRFIGAQDADRSTSPEVFERQVLAFGDAMQAILGSMHVGVVGSGGTGSAVIEQLVRLGVGRLTVVDDDLVTPTNVTRIYGSGVRDVGRDKTDVAAANARRIGLGTDVRPIRGRSTSRSVVDALRECDVVFGCTDDHTGRVDLARLVTWCLIPVFDLGVRIESQAHTITGIWCRVTTQTPGSPCVVCWKAVDQDRMRAEQLPGRERTALAAEGYIPELGARDPAVVAYTTATASLAVNELLLRLTGLAPSSGQQIMFRPDHREIRVASRPANPNHWCSDRRNLGRGTQDPFLGRAAWP
jgi:molybdopterin/thiamine biosynthesis adenylyltransferase